MHGGTGGGRPRELLRGGRKANRRNHADPKASRPSSCQGERINFCQFMLTCCCCCAVEDGAMPATPPPASPPSPAAAAPAMPPPPLLAPPLLLQTTVE